MALSDGQLQALAQFAGVNMFYGVTATYNVADLKASAQAIDSAFDTTLANAVAGVGGNTTVINGLAAVIPPPFNTATAQQKTALACWVLMKRAGMI